MARLSDMTSDICIVVSAFLHDHELVQVWATCKSLHSLARSNAFWKARSLALLKPLMSPCLISAFHLTHLPWAERYQIARQTHPSGVTISRDLLA
ncbi:unnamed protein product, partial [marine sediment metagenome]